MNNFFDILIIFNSVTTWGSSDNHSVGEAASSSFFAGVAFTNRATFGFLDVGLTWKINHDDFMAR